MFILAERWGINASCLENRKSPVRGCPQPAHKRNQGSVGCPQRKDSRVVVSRTLSLFAAAWDYLCVDVLFLLAMLAHRLSQWKLAGDSRERATSRSHSQEDESSSDR